MGRRGGRDALKRGAARAQPARTRNGRPAKPKVCVFCATHVDWVDYKDVNVLRRLMSDRGKIKARRVTGTCRQHQRDVAIAIKTARELALLPYALTPSAADKPGRGGGRDGRSRGAAGAPQAPTPADTDAATGDDVENEHAVASDDGRDGTSPGADVTAAAASELTPSLSRPEE